MQYKIPVYRPSIGSKERRNVISCLNSTWISSKGKFIAEFETKFASFVGASQGVAACNGTVALHLALLAAGIGPGDEVIVPTLTYIASVNAIVYCGARPVFVDSDPETWQISADDVRRKITRNTRAVLIVHLYGHSCDIKQLRSAIGNRKIQIVEDCAEALGTRYRSRHVGTFGSVAVFSFFGNKTITTGEGGMLVSNDIALTRRALHLRGQGLANGREYWHDIIGYNYRMTNICAAIGVAQLERVEKIIAKKRKIARWYKVGLKGLPVVLHGEATGTRHSYWMCSIVLNNTMIRDNLRELLRERGIETRPLFQPVHLMPMYKAGATARFPVACDLAMRGMNLPSYPDLTRENVVTICKIISNYLRSTAISLNA